jgi:hypothetical protein
MVKKILFVLIFCFAQLTGFAQYKNNKWLMGIQGNPPLPYGGSKIEFINSTSIISYDPRNIRLSDCFSGLSDKDDNWFVYSNGSVICNKNNDTLVNGFGLSPGASQSYIYQGLAGPAQVIFFPGDTVNQRHYLFHQNTIPGIPLPPPFMGTNPGSLHLYYSIIDPLAANGQGEVISKNNLVINDTLENGNVLAVRHANGRDWWVLVKRFYEDKFYSILVTPDSVYAPFSYNTQSPYASIGGQACFSPDGKHYAFFSNISQLKIYDFNRCSGILSNYKGKFITNQIAGFTSFSPNSRFLYVASIDSLWQFDMQAPDVLASQTFIAKWDGYLDSTFGNQTIFWWHWLAPDGKIYMVSGNQARTLHVINNPDLPGQACNFQQHSVSIPTVNNFTIPSSINLALYQQPGSPCDTLGVGLSKLIIKNEELKIAPNPSDGRFIVEFTPQRVSGMLYVYDVSGNQVYSEYVSPFSSIKNLDLSVKLTSGMYGVRLTWGGIAGQARNDGQIGKFIVK